MPAGLRNFLDEISSGNNLFNITQASINNRQKGIKKAIALAGAKAQKKIN